RRREHREVIEAGRPTDAWGRLALRQDEQVRAAGAERRGPRLAPVHEEAEARLIEIDAAIQIRDRQVDRANPRGGIDAIHPRSARRGLRALAEQALDGRRDLLRRLLVELAARLPREPRVDAADASVAAEDEGRRERIEVHPL